MGEFFDPVEPVEHRCKPPTTFGSHLGWRCECGKAYVKETLPARDVNPGELPYQWRRAPEHDHESEQA
jgi:hypothetical protein